MHRKLNQDMSLCSSQSLINQAPTTNSAAPVNPNDAMSLQACTLNSKLSAKGEWSNKNKRC